MCIAATAAVMMVTPRYTAETKLLLQPGETTFTRPVGAAETAGGAYDERDLGSQALVASSRDVVRKAIETLKLRGNPEFDKQAQPGSVRSLLMATGLMKTPTEAQREEALIDEVRERLLAFTTGLSRVMTIEFSSQDPQLAARGANTFAALFLEAQAESKKQAARTAGNWLLNTIEPLREKVTAAEARVEEFRARKGLLAAGPNATLPQQQLTEMNTQLSTARSAQADAAARAQLIRDALAAGRPLEISDVANNELVRKLSNDRATLRAQMALESRTLLPGHPRMKELTAQLANVEAEIRASAEKAVRTLENDARVQGARVDQLAAALDDLKSRSARANEDEVELRALEREAKAQREQLESMMTRYRDAVARDAKDAVPADARVIATATPPATPSFPKKVPIILVSTVSTLLVGAAIVVTRELLSGRAFVGAGRLPASPAAQISPVMAARREDAESATMDHDAPQARFAHTPDAADEDAAHLVSASGAATSEVATEIGVGLSVAPAEPVGDAPAPEDMVDAAAVAAALDAAVAAAADGRAPLLLIVPAQTGAARDIAYGIARSQAGRCRAILVDAGAGDPALPGLGDVAAGTATFSDVLHRDPGSRLHLIAAGAPLEGGPERWSAGLLRSIEALRGTYACVVACSPSPVVSPQAQLLAATATHVVYVSQSEGLERDALVAALPPGAPEPMLMRGEATPALRASA